MRSFLPAGCLLVLTVFFCCCVQSPATSPVTPPATGSPPAAIAMGEPAPVTQTRMAVNVSAEQTATEVVVMVTGGSDAAALRSMNIRITNHDGSVNQLTITSPEVGKPYRFAYRGNANAARINIVGTFPDGYQQTILMTTL